MEAPSASTTSSTTPFSDDLYLAAEQSWNVHVPLLSFSDLENSEDEIPPAQVEVNPPEPLKFAVPSLKHKCIEQLINTEKFTYFLYTEHLVPWFWNQFLHPYFFKNYVDYQRYELLVAQDQPGVLDYWKFMLFSRTAEKFFHKWHVVIECDERREPLEEYETYKKKRKTE